MYRVSDLRWVVLKTGRVMFWPVLSRPGRQRVTRYAFEHPSEAAVYGMSVVARFTRRYGGRNG